MPDISLVVPLANFWGVATDELFDPNESETEIVAFEDAKQALQRTGNV